jgi:uncharacterized protein
MENLPFSIDAAGFLSLLVKAFPKSSKNEITGLRGGELIVKINAVAEQGKANQELVEYLSKCLGIAKRDITIVSGEGSRHKRILLPASTLKALNEIIEKANSKASK